MTAPSAATPRMQHIRSSEIVDPNRLLEDVPGRHVQILEVIMGAQSARLAEELIQWLQILVAECTL